MRIYTVYRDNIRSAVASRGPVPPLQRDTSSIMTSIYMIFGIEGAILVLSNNDESLEETNMNKNLKVVTPYHIGTEASPFKLFKNLFLAAKAAQ